MNVTEIWRFPVKSIGGERLDVAEVIDTGIVGDRAWGIFEPSTDTVLTARRAPELLFASARLEGDPLAEGEVVITLPDGTETNSDAELSAWLSRDVTLARPTDEGATYENPLDAENDADWLSWRGPGGSFHDSTRSRLSLVGVDTLGDRDIRRFRTNVVVSGGGEDDLVGRRIRIGTVALDITKQIDRCVMVTRPQPGLERDLSVLKDLIAQRDNLLSVGATVSSSGTIRVGDAVEPL